MQYITVYGLIQSMSNSRLGENIGMTFGIASFTIEMRVYVQIWASACNCYMHQNVSLTRLNKMRISKSTNVLSVLTFTQAKGGGGNFSQGGFCSLCQCCSLINSAFHSSEVSKWVVIHVITLITGWRPLNSRPGRRTVGWSQVSLWPQAWPTAHRLYAHCLWHEQRRCSCCMRLVALYKCYMPMPCAFAYGPVVKWTSLKVKV